MSSIYLDMLLRREQRKLAVPPQASNGERTRAEGEIVCTFCEAPFPDQATFEQHKITIEHKNKVIESIKKLYTSDPRRQLQAVAGVNVTVTVSPALLAGKQALGKITIVNDADQDRTLVQALIQQPETGVPCECVIASLNKDIVIPSKGGRYEMQLRVSGKEAGSAAAYVTCMFADSLGSRFLIIRQVLLTFCQPGFESIAKDSEYRPPPRYLMRPNRKIIGGEPLPGNSTNKLARKPPNLNEMKHIDAMLRQAKHSGISEAIKKLLPAQDSFTAAERMARFKTLLLLEYHQHMVDVQKYNLNSVPLQRTTGGGLLRLKVPGLAENRPSVMRGDRIYARQSNSNEQSDYEGFVWEVEMDSVLLKFASKFHDAHVEGLTYDVRFTVGTGPFRFMLQALDGAIKKPQTFMEAAFDPLVIQMASMSLSLGSSLERQLVYSRRDLNLEQQQAVKLIVAGAGTVLPYVIFGPPGTGKTSTLVEAINQVLRTDPNARILACAPSNDAADVVAQRIHRIRANQQREMIRVYAFSVDAKRIPGDIPLEMTNRVPGSNNFALPSPSELKDKRLVVSTLLMAGKLYANGLDPGYFTHIFIDEAGHADEPLTMCSLALLATPKTKVILAGDPKQLGPIHLSPHAKAHGIGISLLERLSNLYPYTRRSSAELGEHYDHRFITKLVNNYRSHPDILSVPNKLFYDNELITSADPFISHSFVGWDNLPAPQTPLVFHSVSGNDEREGNSPSWFNVQEVAAVYDWVQKILDRRQSPIRPLDIGIVTPYRKQVQKIRKIMTDKFGELVARDIKVGSVEEFQGQERRVIIISTVRSHVDFLDHDLRFKLGFVANKKRMNVAVTRAKSLLIMVGSAQLLQHDRYWAAMINYCMERRAFCGEKPRPDGEAREIVAKLYKTAGQLLDGDDLEVVMEETGFRPVE